MRATSWENSVYIKKVMNIEAKDKEMYEGYLVKFIEVVDYYKRIKDNYQVSAGVFQVKFPTPQTKEELELNYESFEVLYLGEYNKFKPEGILKDIVTKSTTIAEFKSGDLDKIVTYLNDKYLKGKSKITIDEIKVKGAY